MRLLVWGLGYVGTVSAACLARSGHEVVGIDSNAAKVDAVRSGRSPVKEPQLDEILAETIASGQLRPSSETDGLVDWADASLICVGTPSGADNTYQLDALSRVAAEIGRQLADGAGYHVVVVRSTVFPGTVRGTVRAVLEEESGGVAGEQFGLAMNPEFLRETSAVKDFYAPPYTVVGALDERSGEVVAAASEGVDAPIHQVSIEEAELLKLACNAFHALKIGFANEIGRVCDAVGMDSRRLMELLCADTKLNISPAYLRPGFAFGGSCLPKDVRALTTNARRLGLELPILEGALPSNWLQIAAAREKVHELGGRRIAVLGLSFKPGTDDVRESPTIDLVRELWQDGLDVRVYDPDIRLGEMLGTNLEYLERQLPQIREIATETLEETLDSVDMVVVSQRRPEFTEAVLGAGDVPIVDLAGLDLGGRSGELTGYHGLSW